MKRVTALLTLALSATPASAAVVPGATVDGPSADIVSFGGLDVAPDGTAALTYVKKVGTVDHIFVARGTSAGWGSPERVDSGKALASKLPRVAVSSGGRVVVVFINGGGTLESAVAPVAGAPFVASTIEATKVHTAVDIDMNEAGVAYAADRTLSGINGDVNATRLEGSTWTAVPGVLDADATKNSGDSMGAAKIAVTPDGNAVAIWTEGDAGTDEELRARRITGTVAAPATALADVANLDGAPSSNSFSDMGDVSVDGTGRAWVTWRQFIDYPNPARNVPRVIVRPLDGSVFGAPSVVDGLGSAPTEGAEFPSISVNPAGVGILALPRQLSFGTWGATLGAAAWSAGLSFEALTNTAPSAPVAAIGTDGTGLVAWRFTPGGMGIPTVRSTTRINGTLRDAVTLSDSTLGPVLSADGGIGAGVDRQGAGTVAWAQGAVGQVRIAAARIDGPPAIPPAPAPGPAPLPAPTPGPGPTANRPTFVGALSASPNSIRAAKRGGALARSGGSLVRFRLDRAASVRVGVERLTTGARAAKRAGVPGACVRLSAAPAGAKRCNRWISLTGGFSVIGKAGQNSFRFSGRLAGRTLPPRTYRLVLTPLGDLPGMPARVRIRLT